jgi:IPT/TIG domain/Carboxypeptidase regulatory-like domain/PKD-like domain
MNRVFPASMLVLALLTPAAMASKRGPADAPEADSRPAPLLSAPGPAIRVFPSLKPQLKSHGARANDDLIVTQPGPIPFGPPVELRLTHAGSSTIDLRNLPQTPPIKKEHPEHEPPPVTPTMIQSGVTPPVVATPSFPTSNAPAPSPSASFDGLDFATWGDGHPPDTNGDVGPTYYIQTINTSIGVYNKSTGSKVVGFTFNALMSQGHFGNLCDTDNYGDPVVLYDSFEDRWIITDFAFQLSGGSVVNPPGNFQCIAASMTGDPVSGGWNFYSINTAGGLGDYPKFGIWPDGLYMSANMFQYAANGPFISPRVYAFNKAQMYAGKPSVQVVTFDVSSAEFTLLPANARLQAGTPPPGSPNYFGVVWQYFNAVSVYQFHINWNAISTSTLTGPFLAIAPLPGWGNPPNTVPSQGGAQLDTLALRLMMQNQYTNEGGVESLWLTHTVKGAANSTAAPRYYQVPVTGGTVAANTAQAFTYAPDSTMMRFMPSLAVDRAGDMALGYSTSSSTSLPAIKYAGRLGTDPLNSLPQTETVLKQGTGTQTSFTRWGDYSAMTLDPDGCSFWYTNMYYATTGTNFLTRIGSFAFPSCTPFGAGGALHGTVTAVAGGAPVTGATVALGARTTTTNGSGFYSFSLPAGTYPAVTVSQPGFVSQTATSVVVTDGTTTTKDFALAAAATSGCLTDTTQSDFQAGVPVSVDLVSSPGDVILLDPANLNQQNATVTNSGAGFDSVNWVAQTFTPSVTGKLTRADIDLFCSSCTGTSPNLTVSIRATTGSPAVPSGADLATATITGFSSAYDNLLTANFAAPPALTAGTRYAIILRAVSNPSLGTYAYTCSCTNPDSNPYANGQIVTSTNSGGTWTADTTSGGRDLEFTTYMETVFVASGNLVSGLKDSNPTTGVTPIWSTLSWTATTPANTSIKFQLAGSNSDSGPFNFVGPDGTSATFFTTSGASLTQFYGKRYLEYKAYLASTNNTVTPTLNDVSLCFADTDCSAPPSITPSPVQPCPNSTGNTATGPAGATSYAWSISNGTITGGASSQTVTYTAGASGTAGLTLTIVAANGCHQSGSVNVPIGLPAAPTITPGGPTTFCPGGSVSLSSSSATGNQWYLNGNAIGGATAQAYIATAAGNYTVTLTVGGCTSLQSATVAVTFIPLPPTPTITPSGSTAFCTGGSVTLTSSTATGYQWYLDTGSGPSAISGATNQAYVAAAAGGYSVVVTANGCNSSPSATMTVTISAVPPVPTITPGGPTTFCAGNSVTLNSSSNGDNQWYLNGNPIGGATSQAYVATASGDYNVVVTASACSASPSAVTTVTVLPLPATPTITPGGPTTFCAGGSVTLTSSSASNNQWYLNGNSIGGATSQDYIASASGNYTVTTTGGGCTSLPSAATTVTVNPIPSTPTVTPGGPTTFCTGGSVTLNSSSASGNQWFLNGNPIGGATNQAYIANASGSYTVTVTTLGCTSAPSAPVSVTVNPIPSTPTISGGPTSFCAGGSVTLTSSSAAGNQWFSNGSPIGGATGQTYLASVAAGYTVKVTTAGCTSAPSAATTVTVNPLPSAAITAPATIVTGTSGGATVANAGAGATYAWGITNGSITAGGGTAGITFTAGAIGPMTLNVTVTTASSCSDAKTANITVKSAAPDPTVASIVPNAGRITGGSPITINGTGFQSGVTVMIGGNAATNVVFVSSVKLTARTPAHAAGLVSVNINNLDTTTTTVNNAFTYIAQQFDANGDGAIDPSDIFYLVNYLFTHGPAPRGAAGMLSGDANGDGIVDPADIFYVVNNLFTGGPKPDSTPVTTLAETPATQTLAGALSLGQPQTRGRRTYVPVILHLAPDSPAPQAISLKLLFESAAGDPQIHLAGAATNATTSFEISRPAAMELSYLVAFDQKSGGLALGSDGSRTAVVAEVSVAASESLSIDFDPALTLLSDAAGIHTANVARGTLQISGIANGTPHPGPKRPGIHE